MHIQIKQGILKQIIYKKQVGQEIGCNTYKLERISQFSTKFLKKNSPHN